MTQVHTYSGLSTKFTDMSLEKHNQLAGWFVLRAITMSSLTAQRRNVCIMTHETRVTSEKEQSPEDNKYNGSASLIQ